MPRLRHTLEWSERVFFRTVLALFALGAAGLVLLSLYDLPPWLGRRLLAAVHSGTLAWDAQAVRIDPLRGIRLRGVRVYRKGVLGPPAVEAGDIQLAVDPVDLLRQLPAIRRVTIRDGELRPAFVCGGLRDAGRFSLAGARLPSVLVRLEDCRVEDVGLKRLEGRLDVRGGRVRLTGIRADLARGAYAGSLAGWVELAEDTALVHGELDAVMNPALVRPALERNGFTGLARVLGRFAFGRELPQGAFRFETGLATNAPTRVTGAVHLRRARYREVPVLQADGDIEVVLGPGQRLVRVNPLTVARAEGTARGALEVDLLRDVVRFEATSTLDPQAARAMVHVLRNPAWDRPVFNGPVRIEAEGTAGLEDEQAHLLAVRMEAQRVQLGPYELEALHLRARVEGLTNTVEALDAAFCGGRVLVSSAGETDPVHYALKLEGQDLSFEQVARVVGGAEDGMHSGRLSWELDLAGHTGTNALAAAAGTGRVDVVEGRVFMLPLFGGLSSLMTRVVPGLDFVLRQSDAHAAFRVADGAIATDDAQVEGGVFSLAGAGRLGLDRSLDFTVQLTLMKEHQLVARLLRVLTYPISKLFEFRLRRLGLVEEAS